MSAGGSKSNSSNQSQSTSQGSLSPTIQAILGQNYGQAENLANTSSYQPVTAAQIQQYENPYTSDVINTTNAQIAQQNQVANQGNNEQATAQGAFGGTRSAVLNALTNQVYGNTTAQTDAALNAENYGQATNTATTENTAQNQYPLLIQALLNSAAGLYGNPVLTSAQSTGSGDSSSFGINASVSPAPTPH